MKPTLFVPKTVTVGYQERSNTYTGKLAYVIYTDEKGKLRKEASWNSWRNKSIEANVFDNTPTEGFVLNKKVGDYVSHWNHRQAYVRVYDPRGFEFEITIENLLHILENTSSIKGKGLEGEFVYSWDGKDLVLLSVESPDHKLITEYNEKVHNATKLKGKDMIPGATYLTKSNEQLVYLGRFPYWDSNWKDEKLQDMTGEEYREEKKKGNRYYFVNLASTEKYTKNDEPWFNEINGLSTIISVVSEDCHEKYADWMDALWSNTYFNPIDRSKDQFVPLSYEEFESYNKSLMEKDFSWWEEFRVLDTTLKWNKYRIHKNKENGEISFKSRQLVSRSSWYGESYDFVEDPEIKTLKDIYDRHQPMKQIIYRANGQIHTEKVNERW